nr:hypothetical protein [Microvirga aerilata]
MDQPLNHWKTVRGGVDVDIKLIIGTPGDLDIVARKTTLGEAVNGLIDCLLVWQNRPCCGLRMGHWKPPVEVNEESPDDQEGSGRVGDILEVDNRLEVCAFFFNNPGNHLPRAISAPGPDQQSQPANRSANPNHLQSSDYQNRFECLEDDWRGEFDPERCPDHRTEKGSLKQERQIGRKGANAGEVAKETGDRVHEDEDGGNTKCSLRLRPSHEQQ